MPLYEYRCRKCGRRFEKIESLSASPTKKCPHCGGRAERQLTAPAIQFKGSGWYVTDYARKGSGAAAEKSGDGATAAKPTESKTTPSEKSDRTHPKKKH